MGSSVSVDKGKLEATQFLLKTMRPVKNVLATCGEITVQGKWVNNNEGKPEAYALSQVTLSSALTAQPGKPIKLELQLA